MKTTATDVHKDFFVNTPCVIIMHLFALIRIRYKVTTDFQNKSLRPLNLQATTVNVQTVIITTTNNNINMGNN